ncbi:hypothetical protein AUEXF2481DRAFT_471905 [Aureobasidium subglaciale EXF-2481]|uniref:Uncharacterized protein n=1 Tax=Aureobasidium subglaciale (strain EXF-2481) TaxID=1043005 RepID=A0A074YPX5_AURSE|nr:uncharacterized protein AUEXF2481DRAFT_471905 [Aureobasidium subglaciale EXF-2481]KAI5200857.1 hypothetical protein E4T38_06390 [Aureobasidium subglaciale]KAI5219505.1 hypothetical protein E4T40_06358 [Aureobasidium subglaciale]KAI5223235.1 hypothetical protein E4T41_06198 [Aureobasidium subglaciale]KAI5259791.1 hypothetical protein E4T46_06633 [Aureobasidium subglaciale]KEQ98184.1 hypothetical protein AUEXF2481DRAFT_471905 [Aureobasidium subglaciale EXF-2481]
MAEQKTSTKDMPFRAAEGVSRFFLIEALRTGCEDLTEQSKHLGSARDKAKTILDDKSPAVLEALLQDVLNACAKSLQAHAEIVEAVAETIAVNSDKDSVDETKVSNKYALLVGQIKDAAIGVEKLGAANVKRESPPLPTESDFDSEPEVKSSKKPHVHEPKQSTPLKRKAKHISNTSATVKDAPSSDSVDEKPMKGKGKKLSKLSKLSKSSKALEENITPPPENETPATPSASKHSAQSSSAQDSEVNTQDDNDGIPPSTPKPDLLRRESVEDISSEVNARLAAKERKRASKKAAKKRKRDSVASEIFSPDPKAEPEYKAPLPPKKKSRVDKIDGDSKGKRQNVDDAPGSKAKKQKHKSTTDDDSTVRSAEAKQESESEVVEPSMGKARAYHAEKLSAAQEKANKSKRRRSSNGADVQTPAAVPDAFHETNTRKKRRVGF